MSNQHFDVVKSKFELVEQIVLQHMEINGEIDVLIRADFYWPLVTDDIIRLDHRLVAIRSKLSYMLSGFIVDDEKVNKVHSSNCVHVLKVDVNNDNFMSMEENISLKKVENFWNLDTPCIVNEEKYIYDVNKEKIKFVDGCYKISSVFKNHHPIIEDNYLHYVKRLKSMKGKLNKSPEFVKQIKTGFYVDDLAISVTNARDRIDFYTKCKVRFAEAIFNVRKWRTNDPDLKGILADKEVKFGTSN